jgi:DNA-binding NtrC family response regulator
LAAVHRDALTIFIVEDEPLLRACSVEFFQDEGFRVLEADSGEAAVQWIERNTKIDVVFTDITLRGQLNGWDVAEAFRAKNSGLAIIYASGYLTLPPRVVDGGLFFTKPYDYEKVLQACYKLTSA